MSTRRDLSGISFPGRDLSGCDFSDRDLKGANFAGAVRRSTKFRRANLTNANFAGATFGRTLPRGLLVNGACFLFGCYMNVVCTLAVAALGMVVFSINDARVSPILGGAIGAGLAIFTLYILTLWRGSRLGTYFSGLVASAGMASGASFGLSSVIGSLVGGTLAAGLAAILADDWGLSVYGAVLFAILHLTGCALISWRTWKIHEGFESIYWYQVRTQSRFGTLFDTAILAGADFTTAHLRGARFVNSALASARLDRSHFLARTWASDLRFRDPRFRRLLVERVCSGGTLSNYDLSHCNLDEINFTATDLAHADLTRACLRKTNLQDANLSEVQAIGTDFTGANLTGACLRDWNIDAYTAFHDVRCRYFYLNESHTERRPHEADAEFLQGTFEQLFRTLHDTIDLLINDLGNRADWINAFRRVMQEYPAIDPESVHSIRRIGDGIVVTLVSPPGIDKGGVVEAFHHHYNRAIQEPPTNRLLPPPSLKPEPARAKVFISYSREDAEYREQLEKHLKTLQREGLIEIWHDQKIQAGKDWNAAITAHLAEADIVVLLISVEFINSDYAYEREMSFALERAERGQSVVFPILISSCDWRGLPIAALQVYPDGGKPVDKRSNRNEAWTRIIRSFRRATADWQDRNRAYSQAGGSLGHG